MDFGLKTVNYYIRNWSHIATHLVVDLVLLLIIVVVGAALLKSLGSVVSKWIGMKFGRIIPQVNTNRLAESDFRFDVTLSRRRQRHRFAQKLSLIHI